MHNGTAIGAIMSIPAYENNAGIFYRVQLHGFKVHHFLFSLPVRSEYNYIFPGV